ncbi:YccF domain-containing protein [Psychrobium sp. 1_MG-2023]|uniref:YccF domain-containing protein n=1 Tax=Psychrobium sp. 1_MG-2023 TaxID=3062624 RepID=UPI000C3483F3|nr:YccF domain-containing protein [Psychrobium sp. 1_MG-2023]MDP2560381.1 YccF domain-containing protein [Psychrobium sp. 1_MG-2023]PKF55491.1 YccF domain-containing protein [Alteromonadales bacterium alter-6D02]
MSVLRLLFNVAWFICGGLVMGLMWVLAGIIACITIVGIPFARSCFVIAQLSFWPFGRDIDDRQYVTKRRDIGTGSLGTVGNIIWFLLFGIWLAIGHILHAVACFVTIIGIPFGIQHLKLAMLSFAPIGQTVVDAR